jgi:hypothetical protein
MGISTSRLRFSCCVAFLAALATPSIASETAMFMGLGDLAGRQVSTTPVAISADGSVVVGQIYGKRPEIHRKS